MKSHKKHRKIRFNELWGYSYCCIDCNIEYKRIIKSKKAYFKYCKEIAKEADNVK